MLRRVGFFAAEALGNLRRNKLMTVAAVLTAAVSLLLLGLVLTIGDFVGSFSSSLEDQVEVSVYLVDDITPEQLADVRETLGGLDVVDGVTYITKEEAYEEFKELFRDQPSMFENVGPETLPASFNVSMSDPQRVDVIRSRLDGNPSIEEIVDQREIVSRIVDFTNFVRTFSAVLVAILCGAAILLISNTIQLAIYARSKEIEIMKLVGATNWFVRIPFMVEGVVAGVIGSVTALLLLGSAKSVVRSKIPEFIPTVALHGVDLSQVVWLVLLGMTIGVLGSAVAVRRYLEV